MLHGLESAAYSSRIIAGKSPTNVAPPTGFEPVLQGSKGLSAAVTPERNVGPRPIGHPVCQDSRHTRNVTDTPKKAPRARMTARERREQLLGVSKALFAERGFEGTSVEEIAARADVSKPVVYEHFGGKEGVYAVIVDREVEALLGALSGALDERGHPKQLVERAATALLDYIESSPDGFRMLVRDSPVAQATGTFSSLIGDVAAQVEHLLAHQFEKRGLDTSAAPIYSQMLVGMVALTGQHWAEAQEPSKEEVAAHLVNLAWNGLSNFEQDPALPPSE
jgi:AcrR family transcriptional regulator